MPSIDAAQGGESYSIVSEIAAILAAGYLRMQDGSMSANPAENSCNIPEFDRPGLDLSAETRLSVPAG
jgi:hypothetical protein